MPLTNHPNPAFRPITVRCLILMPGTASPASCHTSPTTPPHCSPSLPHLLEATSKSLLLFYFLLMVAAPKSCRHLLVRTFIGNYREGTATKCSVNLKLPQQKTERTLLAPVSSSFKPLFCCNPLCDTAFWMRMVQPRATVVRFNRVKWERACHDNSYYFYKCTDNITLTGLSRRFFYPAIRFFLTQALMPSHASA
jgi:hypothetical protein